MHLYSREGAVAVKKIPWTQSLIDYAIACQSDLKGIEQSREAIAALTEIKGALPGLGSQQGSPIDLAIAALRKNIPMPIQEIGLEEFNCPSCFTECSAEDYTPNHCRCPECGQRLMVPVDWPKGVL